MAAPGIRTLSRSNRFRYLFVLLVLSVGFLALGAFVVGADTTDPDPVPFGETTQMGIAAEERQVLEERGLSIPRAQVFYSQYQYVVGYEGIESAVDMLQQPAHTQQFGYPVVVYVEAFAGSPALTEQGYLAADTDPEWTDAAEVFFVVGSDARTPTGETAVPFVTESAAESFVDDHGGEVLRWESLRRYSFDIDGPSAVRDRVADQREDADERVANSRERAERAVSVVVGESSLQDAIEAAPPGSTVRLPEGTYAGGETVVVDKPLTLRGENATIQGDGNGSVIRVEADNVAIVGLEVTGVGTQTRGEDQQSDDDSWDSAVDNSYGRGDAGIVAADVSGTYIGNVTIETPTSGIILRDAPDSVVEGVAVSGPDEWQDGFMSISAIRSPVVVQHSTFDGNRDGIYLHRSHGSVVRQNTFRDNRFGVHFMFTSDSLVADNVARGQEAAGITIMTSPTRNAVVGNDVRNAETGIIPGGSRSYIAGNVVANNERGMTTGSTQSLYERNVIYGNDLGIRTGTIRPSNRVVRNDFVGNERHVRSGVGPLRIWTHDGVGNYWEGAGHRGGTRSYAPTDGIDRQLHRVDGAVTLAASPARRALNAVRDTTPGMRSGEVVDGAPLSDPANPERLAELDTSDDPTVTATSGRVGDRDD